MNVKTFQGCKLKAYAESNFNVMMFPRGH